MDQFTLSLKQRICTKYSLNEIREICSDETLAATLNGFTTSSVCTIAPPTIAVRPPDRAIILYGLNLEKKLMQHYGKLARLLGIKVVNSYSSKVTHVLVQIDDPHAKLHTNFFSAVLLGQYIIDQKCKYQIESWL